jgi:hypothetical protein
MLSTIYYILYLHTLKLNIKLVAIKRYMQKILSWKQEL